MDVEAIFFKSESPEVIIYIRTSCELGLLN